MRRCLSVAACLAALALLPLTARGSAPAPAARGPAAAPALFAKAEESFAALRANAQAQRQRQNYHPRARRVPPGLRKVPRHPRGRGVPAARRRAVHVVVSLDRSGGRPQPGPELLPTADPDVAEERSGRRGQATGKASRGPRRGGQARSNRRPRRRGCAGDHFAQRPSRRPRSSPCRRRRSSKCRRRTTLPWPKHPVSPLSAGQSRCPQPRARHPPLVEPRVFARRHRSRSEDQLLLQPSRGSLGRAASRRGCTSICSPRSSRNGSASRSW